MKPSAPAPDLPEIDGLEQLDTAPPGSRPFQKRYYRDELESLVKDARALPVRELHVIAPRIGWPKRIYRKPSGSL